VELRQSLVTTFDAASCHYTSKDTVANNDVEQYTIRSVDADMKDFSKYQHDNPAMGGDDRRALSCYNIEQKTSEK
jgi:hypothetical protein